MSDNIEIRKSGHVGRITLRRPQALNALSLDMIRQIAAILPVWADDPGVAMLVIDGVGDRAFCAGGDIAGIYKALVEGDPGPARQLWREEYPVNAALFGFPKPVASFMHGFTMGGGVGIGGHASHRVVCETTQISMPECAIGFVPDVGGSLILARAPGRLGEYLGTTSRRMGPGDAMHAGFADYYVPHAAWGGVIERLEKTGDWSEIDRASEPAPDSPLADEQEEINAHFGGETFRDIVRSLRHENNEWCRTTLTTLERNAPLSMACTVELIHRARVRDRIDEALKQEYRFGHRITEMNDFREGIRAAVIDKDRKPAWQHAAIDAPNPSEVSAMLLPLGPEELRLEEFP